MDEDNNHGEWKVVQGGHGKGPKTRQPNADAAEVESSPSTQEPVLVRFKIITGDFRTEPEVLAMLHVEHPAVKIKIKNTRTRFSILIARDEMTINLLESLDNIRGKKVSFNRMEPAGESRTYVLMGVSLCIPEELLQADPAVISATRMTRWCKQSTSAQPTEMVKVQLAGKEHPPRFTRGYGSYKMRTFNPGSLQCFNCQKYGHLAVSCIREVPTCRYCAGPHTSKDCKGKTDITLKCSNCKGPHATTSMNCQARRNAPGSMVQIVAQTKPVMEAPKKPVKKTVETFVPAAQNFPDSISAAETRKRRRFHQSIPSMPHKKPAASVSVQQLKDPVPPKAALSRHCTWGKQKTLDKQPEVEEPELATITVALQAAWSLLADIKQGNRRLIPALTKMIEAAVDATKLLM